MDAARLAQDPIVRRTPGIVSRIQLAKTIISIAALIEEKYGGDPEGFFSGPASHIEVNLREVSGVDQIARMILIQRILYFGFVPNEDIELLPKLDRHVCRVFARCGLIEHCSDEEVREALEGLSFVDVAKVDQSVWHIGRTYCHTPTPVCAQCPLEDLCPKVSNDKASIDGYLSDGEGAVTAQQEVNREVDQSPWKDAIEDVALSLLSERGHITAPDVYKRLEDEYPSVMAEMASYYAARKGTSVQKKIADRLDGMAKRTDGSTKRTDEWVKPPSWWRPKDRVVVYRPRVAR